MNHGLQHLRCGNDHLARLIALADKLFLKTGQLFVSDLHTHVSACHHNAVGVAQNVVKIVDALDILDLGNDLDQVTAVVVKELAHGDDVISRAHKGRGDKIHIVLDAEDQVALVGFAQERHIQMYVGNVDAFVVADDAAVAYGTQNVRLGARLDGQHDASVVNQNAIALGQLRGQVAVSNGNLAVVAHNIAGSQRKFVSLFQLDRAALKVAHTDLGTAGVKHNGGGHAHVVAHTAKHFDALFMIFMGAVGKVEARHVHAVFEHLGDDLLLSAGRA